MVVHVRYLCMYLYIYTVYVIVELEMWHFIFEGLFVYFFKTAAKDVTFRQNEMMMMMMIMMVGGRV